MVSFQRALDNPFGLSDVGRTSHPTFVDIDGDRDLDAFIGEYYGDTYFFQNNGSSSSPQFAAPQTNPFGLSDVGRFSAPTFADIDRDGDLDAFIGEYYGDTYFFQNNGSSSSPQFAAPQTNPFNFISRVSSTTAPTFVDIDKDGDLDAFMGDYDGVTLFFLNTPIIDALPPLSGAGDQQQFAIAAGDGTVDIINFGGVGQGSTQQQQCLRK